MRLNAYLARTGVASRRGADELIKSGRVRVNGVRGELNTFVNAGDVVDLDGRLLLPQRLAYVLLHKPAGVVTTASDPHGRPTVVGLVEHESRVVPVGRLDVDTTGVLLLTNDGDLAHRLAHPRYEVEKVYEAEVEGEPSDEALAKLVDGVELDDGRHRPGPRPAARPLTHRALDPRGPQAPGQADARGGRSSRPQPSSQSLRRPDGREPRAGRVAGARRGRGRCASAGDTFGAMSVETAVYEQGRRRAEQVPLEDTYEQLREDGVFAWIGLHEPTAEEFESVRREFNLHELAVEDAIQAHQRPKLEFYAESLFVVLKTARWISADERIDFGEILVFVGDGFIVSVSHGDTALHEVRLEMEQRSDLLAHGPSAALYAIVDQVVDDYAPVLDELDNAIRETETEVFSPSRSNPAGRIYQLKRAVLDLLGAVMPLVPEVEKMATMEHPLIDADMRPYFRDIDDHLVRDSVQLQGFRELLTNVLAANLTQASFRQNEDVRRISAWAAIIAVPTAIAGIYGMNFEHMPELKWRIGYPLVLAVIAITCFALYRQFRRVGWL